MLKNASRTIMMTSATMGGISLFTMAPNIDPNRLLGRIMATIL